MSSPGTYLVAWNIPPIDSRVSFTPSQSLEIFLTLLIMQRERETFNLIHDWGQTPDMASLATRLGKYPAAH